MEKPPSSVNIWIFDARRYCAQEHGVPAATLYIRVNLISAGEMQLYQSSTVSKGFMNPYLRI